MITISRKRGPVRTAILVCAALFAVACSEGGSGSGGGGSGDPTDPGDDTPAGVTQSDTPAALSARLIGPFQAFNDVACDASGNIFAVGNVVNTSGAAKTYDFGNSVKLSVEDYDGYPVLVKFNASGVAQSVWTYPPGCKLKAVCPASDGSIVVAGSVIRTTGEEIVFAEGVSLDAPTWTYDYSMEYTFVMKLNAAGTPLWVSADLQGGGTSGANEFSDVCLDADGNIYAAGYIYGTAVAGYINGENIDGTVGGASVAIVKYDADGNPLWGKSTGGNSGFSSISRIAADESGNVYAIVAFGDGDCEFGNGVIAEQVIGYEANAALLKYSSDGTVLWARTVGAFDTGVDTTWAAAKFTALGLDGSGNIYVAGTINDDISYNFGTVSVSGSGNGNTSNVFLLKYDANGIEQWAVSTVSGSSSSEPEGLAVDSSGNSYVCGSVSSVDALGFGNEVSIRGSASYTKNPLLVKFDSTGKALWAKTQIAGTTLGSFSHVVPGASGGYRAIGLLSAGEHGFGDDVTLSSDGESAAFVAYGN